MVATLFDADIPEKNMSTDLVEHRAAQLTPALLIQQAITAGIPLNELREYAREVEAGQAADAYGHALATFQAQCPQIHKRRQIDLGGGKGPLYASLDDIMRDIKPFLSECGLAVTFSASLTDGGQLTAKCFVRHGRHVEEAEITLPVPSQMRVNDTQKMGAALSYAKRYALCAALNIVVTDEDDDAAGQMETIDEEQIATLREWIGNTNSNEKAFLKYLGVQSFAAIPVADFDKALTALKNKAQK